MKWETGLLQERATFLNSKAVLIANALVFQGNLQIHQVHVGQDGQVGTKLSFQQPFYFGL